MRAASFKSLYQKRPHESVQMRTAAPRGAPDTALRLAGSNPQELILLSFPKPHRCAADSRQALGAPPHQ